MCIRDRTVVPVLIEGVDVTGRALRLSRNIEDAYIKQYRGSSILPGAQNLNLDRSRRSMEMLSLFHQLTPPSYLKSPDRSGEETARVARDVGRRADLSAWFTRPCVIVTGFLEESACPIPLRVNGEPFKSQGLTMVRWIYPLPLNEEIAFTTSAAEEETEGSGR